MTRFDPDTHHRRSIRLRGYDYAQAGLYFVTVCTQDRVCLFGDVIDGKIRLNEFGHIAAEEWARTADIRRNVTVDAFVVMPNHVHGIIAIDGGDTPGRGTLGVGARCNVPLRPDDHPPAPDTGTPDGGPFSGAGTLRRAPTTERFGKPTSNSIPTIVRLFKSATTKRINALRGMPGVPVWQRNYYEHVIRDDASLHRIRQYIVENPARWHEDAENPAREVRPRVGAGCNVPQRRNPPGEKTS